MPDTPVIDQESSPVGVAPPVGPETVAVNVKVDPRVAVVSLVVITTLGVTLEITIPYGALAVCER